MKSKVNLIRKVLLLLLLVTGCAPTDHVFLKEMPISSVPRFGYTAQHPVTIWAPTEDEKRAKTRSYLEGLRSENGGRLEVISKTSVPNPKYKDPKIKIYNIFTDEVINKRHGKYLEFYSLFSPREQDTIGIYINTNKKGSMMVPIGLGFANN